MILLTHERQWRGGETVVAFGMFDGVHEGHAQLMRKANELAALHDLKSVVYTFSSHPMATYAPERRRRSWRHAQKKFARSLNSESTRRCSVRLTGRMPRSRRRRLCRRL